MLLPGGATAAPRVITGTVLLPSRKPAAGARVWYGRVNGPRDFQQVEGRADAKGKFRLTIPEGAVQLAVLGGHAGGTAPTLLRLANPPKKDKTGKELPLTLSLSAPVTLTGSMSYSDEKPAIGIPLRVVRLSGTPGTASEPWAFAMQLVPEAILRSLAARTDPAGRFRLAGLPPQVGLEWEIGGDGVLSEGSAPYIKLGAAGPHDVGRLIAVRPGALDVRLLDLAGQPLPGAALHLRPAEPASDTGAEAELARLMHRAAAPEPMAIETDARGFAHVEGLQPGRYDLAFRGKSVSVEIKEGELTGPVVLLGRVHPFTGKVVDASGVPVPGARVTVEIGPVRQAWPPNPAEPVATGADGTFSIADFPWEAPQLVVRAVGGTGEGEQAISPGTLRPPFSLTLQPNRRAAVKGRVLAPNGKPAASAQVMLFEPGPNGPRPIGLGMTDSAGAFRFDGLRPEAAFRVASAAGNQFFQSRPYTLTAPGEVDLGEVRLSPALPGDTSHRDTRPLTEAFALIAVPPPADLAAAEEFAFQYLAAVRAGEAAKIQALTSTISPGYSADLAAFRRAYAPVVPPETRGLTRAGLYAIPLFPRFMWGMLLGLDATSETGRALWPALDRPEWVVVGYRGAVGANVLLVARKEADGWKAVGGLQFEPADLVTVAGDRELIGKAALAPPTAPVIAAASRYLAAWQASRWSEMLSLTHPAAVEFDRQAAGFTRKWERRAEPDRAAPADAVPVLETRFNRWDQTFLFAYPRLLARLRSGEGPESPAERGFPLPEARSGALAVVRYGEGAATRWMLLARNQDRWLVVEPAVSWKGRTPR